MKFSYNWLNDYFGGKLPPAKKLAEKMGLYAFELEDLEKLENGDFIIDWDILPNRSSDCLCYNGIVKELSTIFDLKAKDVLHKTKGVKFDSNIKTSSFVNLKITEPQKILRATKRMALDVEVGPSPDWLKEKLEAMGQKSINNVVDITNYVMWVTGQPVHAFDYDKLAGKQPKNIFIKHAKKGEKIIDLSGEKHELNDNVLVIADDKKSLDIAGIKGGEISGIDENTTKILMSVVNFEYKNIRNTANYLKLQTDASKRYENEIPLHKVERAQKLFGYLLQELAGAKVGKEIIDTNPDVLEQKQISIELQEINSLLGLNLEDGEVENIFKRLNFEFKKTKRGFIVMPTAERLDLNIKEDLIEEVGRIYGYENVPETFPEEGFRLPEENLLKDSKNKIGDVLVSLGFFEVYNRTVVKNGVIKLSNSLNANATTLRNNLLENLLERIVKNLNHSNEPKIFEIGRIFTGTTKGVVDEHYSFAGVIGKKQIKTKQENEIFYQTKGILEKTFLNLGLNNIVWKNHDSLNNERNFVADILINQEQIGSAGINFWEINLERLVKNIKSNVTYKKPSKYPKIERDVAFWVPVDYQVAEAEELIQKLLPTEGQELKLFDIYEDAGKNRKSFAFNIIFQSHQETLSDEFANGIMDKIYKKLEKNKFEIR